MNYEDRRKIEWMSAKGVRVVEIADAIGVHRATIYNEHRNGYKRTGNRAGVAGGAVCTAGSIPARSITGKPNPKNTHCVTGQRSRQLESV